MMKRFMIWLMAGFVGFSMALAAVVELGWPKASAESEEKEG
jgi:preprotein translocase subunit SecG